MADLYTILAKTPDGLSFFVVERDTPGLEVGRHEDKHGIRASNTTGVLLEDVEVPAEHLIGLVEGQGLKQANAVFGYTRLMVGAFGLGPGQAALDRALAYGKTREQFGAPLVEKEGYLLKLLVDHWIDLAAGRAHMEQVAQRIDGGEPDMGTEGSIAKLWCTEAGNRAADAAIQALGGYGYAREYMVEKLRRDVRITTIYEGTSEIQQSIIAMYRWKETVRSKGGYYETLAVKMDALQERNQKVGARVLAGAVRALNAVIQHMHRAKATRNQIVMFTFADMMTICEVACAMAEKAAEMVKQSDSQADMFGAMSRVFAGKAAGEIRAGAERCANGLITEEDEGLGDSADGFLAEIGELVPNSVTRGMWVDMIAVGEALKQS